MKRSMVLMCLLSCLFSMRMALAGHSFEVKVRGEGLPLLLIPGLASDGSVWDEAVAQLEKTYACHILTLPGFSDVLPLEKKENYLTRVRGEIHKYIVEEVRQPVIIIGHSLGGFLGLNISLHHPESVRKLVIVDSYPFYSAVMMPGATAQSVEPHANRMKDMLVNMPMTDYESQQVVTMAAMIRDTTRHKEAVQWSLDSDRETVAQAMYELMTTDLREEIAVVKTPILVLGSWAAGEPYGITLESTMAAFKGQYARAENCRIEIASSAFHFIMWDEPEWFMKQTMTFLATSND